MVRDHDLLFHVEHGDGEPVLLLNGIAMSAATWEPVAAPLAESYRVVRCDLRGQLMSPGDAPPTVLGHAAEVVKLLDGLEVEQTHVAGTSFGGAVAAMLAARWPERVCSLVSIASGDGFDGEMTAEVQRWREACLAAQDGGDRGRLFDVLEETVYSPAWRASHRGDLAERRRQMAALPERWFHGLVALLDTADSVKLGSELGAIRCPALVAAAELDGFIPRERCRALADGIPGARFTVLKGAGHAVVVEQPDRVAQLIGDFLGDVDSLRRTSGRS